MFRTSGLFLVLFISAACSESGQEGTISSERSGDTVVKVPCDSFVVETIYVEKERPAERETPVKVDDGNKKEGGPLRLGRHNFTLHWISWEHPGAVTISGAEDGWYDVKGEQRSRTNDDYIRIEGGLKPVSANELKFRGRIEYRVQSNNGGEVCVKQGQHYTFLSTQGRKYWRLQQMDNCGGGGLVDYIDIYF